MQISKSSVLGWDIGGAHLKAALVDAGGTALDVVQVACPLWRGLDQLDQAVNHILSKFSGQPQLHAITMTGELADIFPDRHSGVVQIANLMDAHLTGDKYFYAGRQGFVMYQDVLRYLSCIASANWLASAEYVASEFRQALFVDFGSTTTDFVLIADGKPQIRGHSDAERLQYEELLYTGMIRTPLMALGRRIPFAGEWCAVAAEYFATAADIYRLAGGLAEDEDMSETADGAGKTREDSARRLARMIGRDLSDAPMTAWIGLAHAFRQLQINMLKNAALRHLSRDLVDPGAPIVAAGMGSNVIRQLAGQLNREFHDVADIIPAGSDHEKNWACVCLPAYAVARLAVKAL